MISTRDGRVINGEVIADGAPLPEGTRVLVLSPDDDGIFRVDRHALGILLALGLRRSDLRSLSKALGDDFRFVRSNEPEA